MFTLVSETVKKIIFLIDASSGINDKEFSASKDLMVNLINALKVSEKDAQYSVITYGDNAKLEVSLKNSIEKNFNLSDSKLNKIGGVRNVDKAFDMVDKQVFSTRSGFTEKVKNGVVVVFTSDNFNVVRNERLNTVFEKLVKRNIDMLFIDTIGGQLNTPMRDITTNYSVTSFQLLPSLLSKLNFYLGSNQGMFSYSKHGLCSSHVYKYCIMVLHAIYPMKLFKYFI